MALIEGVDFTIENGLHIFTREYLVRRGQCCGSGCRNCPYTGRIRIVSMVPSWTETLIACGANVVGRTRFCIHPSETTAQSIGGTKDWNLQKVVELGPDLIVLDRQENPQSMSIDAPSRWFASDIRRVEDVSGEIRRLAASLEGDTGVKARLIKLAERWDRVLLRLGQNRFLTLNPANWPGVIEWLIPPFKNSSKIVYVIWRDPWMTITQETFIGSVLELMGFEIWRAPQASNASRYPVFDIESVGSDTIFFFASEPYPFAKKNAELVTLLASSQHAAALVNGESFSWFGLRSLLFLEAL